ncbi:MAG: AAA family ATPase [Candidatus Lokiarchaeota archaeon]|nr:AAA family ATPase [Candidatus Lokiarchaeota archaeon]MBD3342835.1 AAA family ATPase [Candidatus Lokiarchaeota archaeon]
MSSKKDPEDGEYVFEFYEDDFADILETKPPVAHEDYNKVNFEEDLNEEQLEIVNNIHGPMLVIAGAGSGKTRTIVYSVAKLLLSGVYPSQIMLVTFTNKAANEMISRVEGLLGKRPKGIWGGTFHSIANRFIRQYAKLLGLKPNYTIMDEADANTLMKLSIDASQVDEIEERFPSSKVAKNILSYSINCNKSIQEVLSWKYPQFEDEKILAKLNQVFKIYQEKKAEDSLVDFDDLLVYWNQLLNERSVAQRIARNIKYILVDEYQDTNHIQDEIIYKIAKQNQNHNIMAVGDDAQSIYAFRGANFQNILEFSNKYKNCKTYKITYNYRSTPEILELANDSINNNKKQYKKKMRATRSSGMDPFQVNVSDDEEQAKFIANQILKLRSEGFELKDIAILCRASFHLMKIELELRTKNIPYEVRAGVSFFEKAHIKDLLFHLRILENPYDEIAWHRVFSIIPGLGQSSAAKIFAVISNMKDPISSILSEDFFKINLKGARIPSKGKLNLKKHLKPLQKYSSEDAPSNVIPHLIRIIEDHIKSKYDNSQERLDDLNQLNIYAQKFSTIRSFLENLSLNISNIESRIVEEDFTKDEEEPLILSTIHRAKGLEWRVVFIPMLTEDFFPSRRVRKDSEEFEEERRVFYVAITRAKDQIYMITPAIIQRFGGYETARISQFVEELNDQVYKESSVHFISRQFTSKKKAKKDSNFRSALDLL